MNAAVASILVGAGARVIRTAPDGAHACTAAGSNVAFVTATATIPTSAGAFAVAERQYASLAHYFGSVAGILTKIADGDHPVCEVDEGLVWS
ncbi:hypothetical protein [Streptomyces sp. NPDC001770]